MINQAITLKQEGKLSEALAMYDQVYGELVKEATEHARSQHGTVEDEGSVHKILPQYFQEADEYMKKDKTICTILNNMGVIFAELGEKISAKKYFEESIKYTPSGMDYENPRIGLTNLE